MLNTGCFPNLPGSEALALGTRWIAYPGNSSLPQNIDQSKETSTLGEISVNVAKKTMSGLYSLGEFGVKAVTSYMSNEGNNLNGNEEKIDENPYAGTVIVRDILTKRVIAHFKAHSDPIAFLSFDETGTLLVTSCIKGNYVNVYQILPSIDGEITSNNYRHIYKLYRGLTNAIIRDIQFSINSKWVSVSSAHGTTHIFAITPIGGLCSYKSHSNLIYTNSEIIKYQEENKTIKLKKEEGPLTISTSSRIHNGVSMFSGETNPKSFFYSTIATKFFNNLKTSNVEHLLISVSTGDLFYYKIEPSLEVKTENGLDVKISQIGKWSLLRNFTQEEDYSEKKIKKKEESEKLNKQDIQSVWISNIEIETYCLLDTPIYKNELFKFKTYQKQSSPRSSNGLDFEEMDLTKTLHIKRNEIPLTSIKTNPEKKEIEKAIITPIQKIEKPEKKKEVKNVKINIEENFFTKNEFDDLSPTLQEGILTHKQNNTFFGEEDIKKNEEKKVEQEVQKEAQEEEQIDKTILKKSYNLIDLSSSITDDHFKN